MTTEIQQRPPITFPVRCDACARTAVAKFYPIGHGYDFDFKPMKIVKIQSGSTILTWHILCTDCVLKFDDTLDERYPAATRSYTIAAHDSKRLSDFLRQKAKVVIERSSGG